MDYESIIRNSNTIFSTMKCPECGKPLLFGTDDFRNAIAGYSSIYVYCSQKCYKKNYSVESICSIINNNGLNPLVRDDTPNKRHQDDTKLGNLD